MEKIGVSFLSQKALLYGAKKDNKKIKQYLSFRNKGNFGRRSRNNLSI